MKYQIAIKDAYLLRKKAFIKEFRNDVHYNKWHMNQIERGNKIIHTSLAL